MQETKFIELDKLLLDEKNPRIYKDISENISQLNLAEYIYNEFGIKDLNESLKKNGYFTVEPMVVVENNDDTYTVVEGNRRLTAIKILCYDEYRDKIISTHRKDDYKVTEDVKKNLETIPVVIAKDRDSVKAYLGVRHLQGVRKWEAVAQSKYVYDQILHLSKKNSISISESIEKFINETNHSKNDVLNHFYKYAIYLKLREISDNNNIKETLDDKFSLLEVSLGKTGTTSIAKYIGLKGYNQQDPKSYDDIITDDYERQTVNLINWVFSKNPLITDSRRISKDLKPILNKKESTKHLEETGDIEAALLLSDTYKNIIDNSISNVRKNIANINKYWSKIKPEEQDELKSKIVSNIFKYVDSLKKEINVD